ncbi:Hint domain-containing protein [Pendulispora rubella]|uniref:Hint domain-containing protein n=1 Tax=Pendulispora rubella TaxID=2741070 RepID=A0ABZ2KWV3_9BACT
MNRIDRVPPTVQRRWPFLTGIARLLPDRRGVSAIEYALLLVAVLLVVAAGYRALGGKNAKSTNNATAVLMGGEAAPVGGGGGGATPGGSDRDPGVVCDGRSCGAPGACFVAGTLVATPQGERPIESLKVGDQVFARSDRDDRGDEAEARRISNTFVRPAPSLVDVHVITLDDAHESIRSTPEHLYFTRDRGWLGAGDLVAGETLLDRAGREVQVTKVVPIAQSAAVYNLEVESDHTYFVGRSSVWVHNQPCGTGTGTTGTGTTAAPPPPVTGPVPSTGGSGSGTTPSTASTGHPSSVGGPAVPVPSSVTNQSSHMGGGVVSNVTVGTGKKKKKFDVYYTDPAGHDYVGGGTFKNNAGTLPTKDASGNPITYKEYDTNSFTPGVNRGADRVVIGSDGTKWYTNDHYGSFTRF